MKDRSVVLQNLFVCIQLSDVYTNCEQTRDKEVSGLIHLIIREIDSHFLLKNLHFVDEGGDEIHRNDG